MIAPRENSMTQRRFDLIAFDWDGTLFDSTALIARCIQAACRDVGEVSIGHAIAADALELGMAETVRAYQRCIRSAYA